MTDLTMLDRAYNRIMQAFITSGQAPHYVELADVPMIEATMERFAQEVRPHLA